MWNTLWKDLGDICSDDQFKGKKGEVLHDVCAEERQDWVNHCFQEGRAVISGSGAPYFYPQPGGLYSSSCICQRSTICYSVRDGGRGWGRLGMCWSTGPGFIPPSMTSIWMHKISREK